MRRQQKRRDLLTTVEMQGIEASEGILDIEAPEGIMDVEASEGMMAAPEDGDEMVLDSPHGSQTPEPQTAADLQQLVADSQQSAATSQGREWDLKEVLNFEIRNNILRFKILWDDGSKTWEPAGHMNIEPLSIYCAELSIEMQRTGKDPRAAADQLAQRKEQTLESQEVGESQQTLMTMESEEAPTESPRMRRPSAESYVENETWQG